MRKVTPSEILTHEECPRKWFYTYRSTHKKERKVRYAFYRLSSCLHHAIVQHLVYGDSLLEEFEKCWSKYRDDDAFPMIYKDHESWQTLLEVGRALGMEFMTGYAKQGLEVMLAEQSMEYIDPSYDYVMKCRPDIICSDHEGVTTILEIKVTETPCNKYWVHGSDQLTAYGMVAAQQLDIDVSITPVRVLLCNLHKQPEGATWLWSERTEDDTRMYRLKVQGFIEETGPYLMAEDIPRRALYSWSSPCNICDFQEVCYGETASHYGGDEKIFDEFPNPFIV